MSTDAIPGRPAIDYTDKDFRSLRAAMLRLAAQRLPEWTDQSPADLGMLLVDMFAYVGDIVLYYQDRIASELFPGTALERESIVDLLRLIGYELRPAGPAMADLQLTFAAPTAPGPVTVRIPHGAQFASRPPGGAAVEFIYLGTDLDIALDSDQVRPLVDDAGRAVVRFDHLPVQQSSPVGPLVIGSSTGEPNQSYRLPSRNVVLDSVVVEVLEGANWVTWERRDSLLFDIAADGRASFSHPEARRYQLLVDASGTPQVVFGDGRRPPVATDSIRAGYRVCAGAGGNVAANTISTAITTIERLTGVTNPAGAAGGTDAERSDHALQYAPLAFRSVGRAVTTSDYVALAQSTGAVAKVRAHSTSWNQIDLYVAPAGSELRIVPESLRHSLIGFFEDKRMASTLVRILDAQPVAVDIAIDVVTDERFVTEAVLGEVRTAIGGLLSFARVDFGQTLFQSDVYAVTEAVPGVIGSRITRFRRHDQPEPDLDGELARHGLPSLAQLPEFLQQAISAQVTPDGRLDVGEFEIPLLGSLSVRARTDL
jgi:hypothetical protein